MNKIEIEVPDNKIANVEKQSNGNILVTFEEKEHWKNIKTFDDAYDYCWRNNIALNLLEEYSCFRNVGDSSYSKKVCQYRIIVAALTNNEERHFTTDNRWFPIVQFCEPGKEKNCYESEILGTIESEGQKYTVVGSNAAIGTGMGLDAFYSNDPVSNSWTDVVFRSVSRCEIAQYISKQFGRLLFEICYGGVNCDWKWID